MTFQNNDANKSGNGGPDEVTVNNGNPAKLFMAFRIGQENGEAGPKIGVLCVLRFCNEKSFLTMGPTVEDEEEKRRKK